MDAGEIDPHPRNVIFSYLSRAANEDETSRIISGGPHGGYSLEKPPEEPGVVRSAIPDPDVSSVGLVFQPRERCLYPLVKAWLGASEYKSEDVSALKSGGQWGNPDILGVSRIEILGVSEIELVSVEVKVSESNWERFIFEAVSHKRFSNRSWFCYRTSTPHPPLPKHMSYYAERYKVGIIQIYLTDCEIKKISDNPEESTAYLDRVQERVRALYEHVPLQEKRAFLQRAGMELTMQVNRSS